MGIIEPATLLGSLASIEENLSDISEPQVPSNEQKNQ